MNAFAFSGNAVVIMNKGRAIYTESNVDLMFDDELAPGIVDQRSV